MVYATSAILFALMVFNSGSPAYALPLRGKPDSGNVARHVAVPAAIVSRDNLVRRDAEGLVAYNSLLSRAALKQEDSQRPARRHRTRSWSGSNRSKRQDDAEADAGGAADPGGATEEGKADADPEADPETADPNAVTVNPVKTCEFNPDDSPEDLPACDPASTKPAAAAAAESPTSTAAPAKKKPTNKTPAGTPTPAGCGGDTSPDAAATSPAASTTASAATATDSSSKATASAAFPGADVEFLPPIAKKPAAAGCTCAGAAAADPTKPATPPADGDPAKPDDAAETPSEAPADDAAAPPGDAEGGAADPAPADEPPAPDAVRRAYVSGSGAARARAIASERRR